MLIDEKTMMQMHEKQFEMFCVLKEVMDKMGIKYYFVHGSLLGAVTIEDFILEDDDIDIAVFRKDYERLITEGNDYLPTNYFIQSSLNDDFPLAFAKIRDNNTAFIQPVLNNYKCNKGIYIDIFPIDYQVEGKISNLLFSFRERLLSERINGRLLRVKRRSILDIILNLTGYIRYPFYKQAIQKREELYISLKKTNLVRITNGKSKEKSMPREWFGQGEMHQFHGIQVNCPDNYDAYLKRIYSEDYLHFNPAHKRINQNRIEVSADTIDFEKSYQDYNR